MKALLSITFLALLALANARTAPLQDEYTLQAIEELRQMSAETRLLSQSVERYCKEKNGRAIECCIGFNWMKQNRSACIDVGFNFNRIQVEFGLSFDGIQLIRRNLTVGQICAPIPGLLSQLNVCAHAYYVVIDTKPPRTSFEACFLIKLGGFFHLKLNCIELDKNGTFSQNTKIQPDTKGLLVLSLEEGDVKFENNHLLSKETLDKIKLGWSLFEKASSWVGSAKEWMGVSDGAKNVEKELDEAADKAKETVVGDANKDTAAAGGFGNIIGSWFG